MMRRAVRGAAWALSQTGNWSGYQLDANGDGDYTDAGDLNQTRTHDAVNQITGISEEQGQTAWADPAHDAAGNGTTLPRPGDEANTLTCAYDAWNRLVEVKIGATTIERNEYDGLNRRVVKQFDSAAPADPDGLDAYRHYYYNSAWQILETRKSDSAATAPQTLQPEWQYVWSPRYIDAAVLRDRNTDADDLCDDERLYYCNDANMNVTTLTDENGDAVERYAYDAYGQPTVYDGTWSNTRSTSSYDNEILYCGYVFDWPTRLCHVRRRPYHCTLGRWPVRDPKDQDKPGGGYHDGMNGYEYCKTNSLNKTDHDGQMSDFGAFLDMADHWMSANGNTPFRRCDGEWGEFIRNIPGWDTTAVNILHEEAERLWNSNQALYGHTRTPKKLMFINGYFTTYVLNGVQYEIWSNYTINKTDCSISFYSTYHIVTDRADAEGFKDAFIYAAEIYGWVGGFEWLMPPNFKRYQEFDVRIVWFSGLTKYCFNGKGNVIKRFGGWPINQGEWPYTCH